jgi:hypothetical protein
MSPKRPIQLIAVDGQRLEPSPVAFVLQAHLHLGDALRQIAATLEDPSAWHGLSTEVTQLQQIVRALRLDSPTLANSLMDVIIELTTLTIALQSKVVHTWAEGYRHGLHDGQAQPRKRKRKENAQ